MDHTTWDESIVGGLRFLEHTVLQVPFFLMTMMRYVTPTLDRMFVISYEQLVGANGCSGSWTPSYG
jgi:hypothetical protein